MGKIMKKKESGKTKKDNTRAWVHCSKNLEILELSLQDVKEFNFQDRVLNRVLENIRYSLDLLLPDTKN